MSVPTAQLPPLNDSKAEFRAILLHASSDEAAILACTLTTISLDDALDYEALSYVWGELEPRMPILVNGILRHVTPNLGDALMQFRTDGLVLKPLFVDALCINQDDLAEKAAQVALMGRIYKQATLARAWLGQAQESGVDRALEILRLLNQEVALTEMSLSRRPIRDNDLRSIAEFWNLEYWNRAWVVQEFALPKQVVVHWDKHIIDRMDLPLFEGASSNSIINQFQQLLRLRPELESEIDPVLDAFSYKGYTAVMNLVPSSWIKMFRAIGIDYEEEEIVFDATTWEDLRRQKASLPHDHVFAYLGLLGTDVAGHVRVDYSTNISAVFSDFTLILLKYEYQNPSLLNWAVGQQENPDRVPSWSLRFGNVQWVGPVMRFVRSDHPSAVDFKLVDGNLLSLSGYCLDNVVATSRICTDELFPNLLNAFSLTEQAFVAAEKPIREFHKRHRLMLGLPESAEDKGQYSLEGSLEDAYWSTLVQDSRPPLIPSTRVSNFLSRNVIRACVLWLETNSMHALPDAKESFQLVLAYHNLLFAARPVSHLFKTKSGLFGTTNRDQSVENGDNVVLLAGAKMPFVLRPTSKVSSIDGTPIYELITAAYVHGVMARNVYASSATEEIPATDWTRDIHPHDRVVDGRWHEVLIA